MILRAAQMFENGAVKIADTKIDVHVDSTGRGEAIGGNIAGEYL